MKQLKIIMIFLAVAALQSGKQPTCDCIKFLAESKGAETAVVANLYIVAEDRDQTVLKGNCTDVLREYLLDEQKREYEKESIVCVSRKQISFTIDANTEFYFLNSTSSEYLKNQEAREFFLNTLLPNKNIIYKVEYRANSNVVAKISRVPYLEESFLEIDKK